MKKRVISALAMLPLLLVVYVGGRTLLAVCLAVGAAAVTEFFRAFEAKGVRPSKAVAYVFLCLLYLANAFWPTFSAWGPGGGAAAEGRLYALWVVAAVAASFIGMFKAEEGGAEDGLATAAGLLYIGFFSFHVALADQLPDGLLKWLIFITAFGTDIMAFLVGSALGKHKLCPWISPKKTVEGAVGGLIGSVAFCVLFGALFMPHALAHCAAIGVLGGVAAQLGDLTASVFKRKLGVKDYGDLIPGHGGVMDRADSLLFTAPVVYYYGALVLGGLS
ncbi:MAG: phosphatidate cytidylyltransferase [Clostridiales Family XIII bacterium]|jgi:phosphatidate cytidylyltransferase|nr:phosphatidate cytidylyltransferase [Clostridiales Family XIII bacterium]